MSRPARRARAAAAPLALPLLLLALAPAAAGFEVIAHRGLHLQADPARADAPCAVAHVLPADHGFLENTLPSLRAAFERGATVVEVDLRVTADGHLVLFHDATLDCRTDAAGAVSEHTLAALRRLDVGHGYTTDGGRSHPWRGRGVGLLPSLADALAALPGRRLLLHPKDTGPRATRLLADALAALPRERQALLHYWGDAERLAALRARAPGLPPARFLAWGTLRGCILRDAWLGWLAPFPATCRGNALLYPHERVGGADAAFRRFARRARAAGAAVHLAGVDAPAQLARARALGADGVMTDRIEVIGPRVAGPLY